MQEVYFPCPAHQRTGEVDVLKCADCRIGKVAYYDSTTRTKGGTITDTYVVTVPHKTEGTN